ncbi:uncharacterized protein LOC129919019 [Episyrphus balteatus]|uniref:uncharacterized protein LOC129919019 n=1 Tax=Episyrphus balteatus TaxID=286459 RepID=UPI0024868035|nr:uncharacterized protein LOC129919019 [Episyrphus balteatus]
MLKWLRIDKGHFHSDFHHYHHHRNCNNKISSYYDYWTVKYKKAISTQTKVLILLITYVILSAHIISKSNAQSLNRTTNNNNNNNNVGKDASTASYEEFIFEHQVTRQDAIAALQKLNQSFFDGPSASTCKSITCTKNVMKYCLGPQFINDHCWCEQGHANEGLPFIPHICYVGEKQYQASVGSCFFYEEVKECCCAPALAKRWKHISAGTMNAAYPPAIIVALAFATHVLLNHFH